MNIDDVREYWDRRPCNIRHSRCELGTKEYFEEVEQRKYFVEPHIPAFAEFSRWRGRSVLEIGCGIGTDAVNFARCGAFYTGIDLSPQSLEIARRRFEVFGLEGDLILGNAEKLPESVIKRKFDLVYSFGVIHHTPEPRAAIQEVMRVMHRDTELRMMLYSKSSWKCAMIEAGFDQPEAQSGCPIANTYSEESARSLLSGFSIESLSFDHIFPYVIDSYLKYEYVKQPWFGAMPEDMFRALELKFGWHMLIKAKLK